MTDMQPRQHAIGSKPPEQVGAITPEALAVATEKLLNAINLAADQAAADDRGGEAKDWGAAALAFAQTIITLDPTRLSGGDTPQARADAAPPQPPATMPKRPPTKDGDRDGKIGS